MDNSSERASVGARWATEEDVYRRRFRRHLRIQSLLKSEFPTLPSPVKSCESLENVPDELPQCRSWIHVPRNLQFHLRFGFTRHGNVAEDHFGVRSVKQGRKPRIFLPTSDYRLRTYNCIFSMIDWRIRYRKFGLAELHDMPIGTRFSRLNFGYTPRIGRVI